MDPYNEDPLVHRYQLGSYCQNPEARTVHHPSASVDACNTVIDNATCASQHPTLLLSAPTRNKWDSADAIMASAQRQANTLEQIKKLFKTEQYNSVIDSVIGNVQTHRHLMCTPVKVLWL